MKSERFVITDNVWEKIWRHLPGKATDRGVTAADKIKEFRGIATRYDKTDISYAANWNLVATIIAMR